MKRLLRLTLATALCCTISIVAFSQTRASMKRSYKMAYYDVDDDCYKDTTFNVYVLMSRTNKVHQYSIEMFDTKVGRTRSQYVDRIGEKDLRTKRTILKPIEMSFEDMIIKLKKVKDKFAEWSATAKQNKVKDFTKELDERDYSFHFGITFNQSGKTYFGKKPFFLASYFRVTDTGDCLLIIKPKHNCVICIPNDNTGYLALNEFGEFRFSTPEQIGSLIDALTQK